MRLPNDRAPLPARDHKRLKLSDLAQTGFVSFMCFLQSLKPQPHWIGLGSIGGGMKVHESARRENLATPRS